MLEVTRIVVCPTPDERIKSSAGSRNPPSLPMKILLPENDKWLGRMFELSLPYMIYQCISNEFMMNVKTYTSNDF